MSRKLFEVLDNMFSQSKIIEINDQRYVLKNYNYEPGLIKWFLVKTANLIVKVYPYVLDPATRMNREIIFLRNIRNRIHAPRIILIDWMSKQIIREYIEGKPIDPSNQELYKVIGETLARIHLTGYVIGDAKYLNFIHADNIIYIIDGEQAIETNDKRYMAWDIAEFLITAIYHVLASKIITSKIIEKYTRLLINGYCEINTECSNVLTNIYNTKIKKIIYLLLPIPYSIIMIKTIKEAIHQLHNE